MAFQSTVKYSDSMSTKCQILRERLYECYFDWLHIWIFLLPAAPWTLYQRTQKWEGRPLKYFTVCFYRPHSRGEEEWQTGLLSLLLIGLCSKELAFIESLANWPTETSLSAAQWSYESWCLPPWPAFTTTEDIHIVLIVWGSYRHRRKIWYEEKKYNLLPNYTFNTLRN